ncbi:MAG: hypothetical protein D3916_09275, partial [Candidatus Electrothrix sp. MAN1_4]|nr:hypothetical protein [Candidatus Electrothrix sp. MAN1_4]
EYRWPLLDQRLIQHFLATPSVEKYSQGIGRYLHKRAVDDLMPQKVTWKQGKDMGGRLMAQDRSDDHAVVSSPVQSFSVQSLHPLLTELVDGEKLTEQQQQLCSKQSGEINNAALRANRNLGTLSQLDIWLKEYLQV